MATVIGNSIIFVLISIVNQFNVHFAISSSKMCVEQFSPLIADLIISSFNHVVDLMYDCKLCQKHIKGENGCYKRRKQHFVRMHTKSDPIHCSICNKLYKDSNSFSTHMSTFHKKR